MRAIWINEGDELNVSRVGHFGINRILWSERTHGPEHIRYARNHGFEVGIYSNPQWYGFPPPKEYRDHLNAAVTRMLGNEKQLEVQINFERKDPDYIAGVLYWWRRVRQLRDTSWNLEGFQGGWAHEAILSPQLRGVRIVPQCYSGTMEPWDSFGVVRDLTAYLVPVTQIAPMIDATEANRRGWFGYAYMQHRLPE